MKSRWVSVYVFIMQWRRFGCDAVFGCCYPEWTPSRSPGDWCLSLTAKVLHLSYRLLKYPTISPAFNDVVEGFSHDESPIRRWDGGHIIREFAINIKYSNFATIFNNFSAKHTLAQVMAQARTHRVCLQQLATTGCGSSDGHHTTNSM